MASHSNCYSLNMYVTNNTLLWICTVSKHVDIILPSGDNSLMVIIHGLCPFIVVGTGKGAERVATDNQCLPAMQCQGVLPC